MSKLKVGDKVRLTGENWGLNEPGHPLQRGNIVTVKAVEQGRLRFEEYEQFRSRGGYNGYAWYNNKAGYAVEKVEESEMVDVKIGDLVKLTRKGEPERTVTDYVTRSDRKELVLKGDVTGYYHSADWDVEVLKRPYKLPTVPGLYTVAKANDKILGGALFELNEFGDWTANGNLHTPYAGDLVVDFLKKKEWPLKRLVIEE